MDGYNVTVDDLGFVCLDMDIRKLSQREAIDIAIALTEAAQQSVYRGQIGTSRFHSSVGIQERQNSRLGRAIAALKNVYS